MERVSRGWVTMAVVLGLSLNAAGPANAEWHVWVERPGVKVFPDRAPGDAGSALVEAARNEWEGFQIVVRSDTSLTGIDVELPVLSGPDGASIAIERTHTYLEWFVEVTNPSDCYFMADCAEAPAPFQRHPGLHPDPLVPLADPYDPEAPAVAAPFDIEADVSRTLFVDVYVPPDAPAGVYEGDVVVRATGETAVTIPVTLVVWDFGLPAERRVATAFGFGDDRLDRFHGGPDGPDPETKARILRNYLWTMREHHMDRRTITGPVDFLFDEEGELLPVDWTAYDAAVGPMLDGDYWPDGYPPVRFNTAKFRPGSGQGSLTADQWAAAAAAFAEHLDAKGWLERSFIYSRDEPFLPDHQQAFEQIPIDVALLNQDTDLWDGHIFVTNPLDERLIGSIDIWCPVTPMYEGWFYGESTPKAGREEYDERRALGEELWFYTCNANFPTWAGYDIDARLGHEPRIVKWGTYFEKASGFLHWRATYWVDDDPWNVLANNEHFGDMFARNGDGMLLYPGDHDGTAIGKGSPEGIAIDGPVVSYRMKMIRDGLEDWEMFLVAEELGAAEYARAQVGRAYRQFGQFFHMPGWDIDNPPWTLDDALLHEVRRNVAAKIMYLRDPDTYPDPEAPTLPEPGPELGPADVAAGDDADAGSETIASTDTSDAAASDATTPVDVSAGGDGGGCRSGAGTTPESALLVLVLLAGTLIQRRRRAPRTR